MSKYMTQRRDTGLVDAMPLYSTPPTSNIWGWWKVDGGAFTDAGKTTPCADTNSCYTLADSSGNGRDLVQATAGARPVYATGALNGFAGLTFTRGSSQFLAKTSETLTQPLTMYVVGKNNDSGYAGVFLGGADSSTNTPSNATLFLKSSAPDNLFFTAGSTQADFGTTATSYFLAMGVANGAGSFGLLNDGAEVASSGTGSLGNTTISMGAYSDGTFPLGGSIIEAIVYSEAHASASGSGLSVRQYLNSKYNLGLSL